MEDDWGHPGIGAVDVVAFVGLLKANPLADNQVWGIADDPLVIDQVDIKASLSRSSFPAIS